MKTGKLLPTDPLTGKNVVAISRVEINRIQRNGNYDIEVQTTDGTTLGIGPIEDIQSALGEATRLVGLRVDLPVSFSELAIPALRMAKRVLEDESELDDIEASFIATDMIDKALAQIQPTGSSIEEAKHKYALKKFGCDAVVDHVFKGLQDEPSRCDCGLIFIQHARVPANMLVVIGDDEGANAEA